MVSPQSMQIVIHSAVNSSLPHLSVLNIHEYVNERDLDENMKRSHVIVDSFMCIVYRLSADSHNDHLGSSH